MIQMLLGMNSCHYRSRHWYADTGKPILGPISQASRMRSAQPAGPKITLRFPRLCVHTYHVHNN